MSHSEKRYKDGRRPVIGDVCNLTLDHYVASSEAEAHAAEPKLCIHVIVLISSMNRMRSDANTVTALQILRDM